MTPEAFFVIAARTRMGQRAVEAARLHLVECMTLKQAGLTAGWIDSSAEQLAWRAVQRIYRAAEADPVCPVCGKEK